MGGLQVGTIPPSIAEAPSLEVFVVEGNMLEGPLPPHLPPRVSSDSSDSNAAVSALVPILAAHSEPTAYPKPNLTGDGGGPA